MGGRAAVEGGVSFAVVLSHVGGVLRVGFLQGGGGGGGGSVAGCGGLSIQVRAGWRVWVLANEGEKLCGKVISLAHFVYDRSPTTTLE